MYFVYILRSLKDHQLYIGFSTDVYRRLDEHNMGSNQSTKARCLFELLYYEAHTYKEDALRWESYFKTAKGKSTLRQMLRNAFVKI